MAIGKNDQTARETWGFTPSGSAVYDEIPKSVFALVAFHLSNLCAHEGQMDNYEGIKVRFREEVEALIRTEILDLAQGKRALAILVPTGPVPENEEEPLLE